MPKNWANIFIFSLLFIFQTEKLAAQKNSTLLDRNIKIEINETTLGEYLTIIVKQGINLAYSSNYLQLQKKINVNPGIYKVGELLKLLLKKEAVSIKPDNNKIIIYPDINEKPEVYTLSGFIYAGNSLEALPNATLRIINTNQLVHSNDYGFYSVDLPKGYHYIKVSYIGFATQIDTIQVSAATVFNFRLQSGIYLSEIKISSKKTGDLQDQYIDTKKINSLPLPFGNADLLKALELKAGVASGGTGEGISVRGGTADQNLIILDGAPVYNYSHFTGIISIFNNDAIKRADFFKGGFPSRYEGRLSSVIDVKTKDGDMQHYHGSVGVGLLTGSAMLEGPLIKDKVSFMGSFRRSWIDGLSHLLFGQTGLKYYLYDANLKINYRIDSANRIYLSGYSGSDRFNFGSSDDDLPLVSLHWSNKLLSFRWNRVHSPKIFSNTSIILSAFKNQLNEQEQASGKQLNQITDIGIDNDLSYNWNNELNSHFGLKLNFTKFRSTLNQAIPDSYSDQRAVFINAYTDNNLDISPKIKLNVGLHYTAYVTPGKTYHSFQPRNTINYEMDSQNQFHASYAIMAQFYHQITFSALSLPTEFRAASNADLQPQRSEVYEIGYNRNLNATGKLAIQLYRKNLKDIVMYRPQQNMLENILATSLQNRLIKGNGHSQGIELTYDQNINWISLQASYTYSKTMLTFNSINNGTSFRSPNDFPHQLNVVLIAKIGNKWSSSATFSYNSGHLISLPNYLLPDLDATLNMQSDNSANYYAANTLNNYRLPNNYSLNIGAVYSKVYKHGQQSSLRFGINNLIGKPAPFLISTSLENNNINISQFKLYKFLPYLGYSYAF